MKKRICLVFLSVILLLSAVSCSDKPSEAYTMYTAARELYLSGYEASVSIKVNDVGGSVRMKVQGDSVATVNSEKGHSRYFVDGINYQSGYIINGTTYDDKLKFQNTKEEFLQDHMQFFGINPYAQFFPVFTEEELKDTELSKSGNYRSFSATLTTEAIKTYFGDESITYGEGSMAASFDQDDHMRRMALLMLVTYANGSQKSFEIVYDFANPGLVPGVIAPEDPNGEYFEM